MFLQKKFRYKEGEDKYHCWDVLEAIATKRVTEELHEARDAWTLRYGTNIQLWKATVPHWCLDHPNWHGLCDLFFTEDWKKISAQNQVNRTKRGLLTAHHGGSASAQQHHQMLVNNTNYYVISEYFLVYSEIRSFNKLQRKSDYSDVHKIKLGCLYLDLIACQLELDNFGIVQLLIF